MNDPIIDYLKQRGLIDGVTKLGLEGMIARWERIVDEVAAGYKGGFEDYLNDMDLREILHEALTETKTELPENLRERLKRADSRLEASTRPAIQCLWGEINRKENHWNHEDNPWYFRLPEDLDFD